MPAAMIEVEDLHKRYRHMKAVDGLSFTAKPGEVTGFLGPNGAGKTTTIDMILGLAQPDGGEARIAGKPFRQLDNPTGTVGAVLAGGAFNDHRSARASLHATALAAGLPVSRIAEVLEAVGLADAPDRHVGAYSLGMRQRLSLAQALLGDPDVLILDEPGNGLDPAGLKWLRDTLRSLAHDRGKTVMLSSHILSEVQETVDVAVVIAEGQLVSEFSLAEAAAEDHVVIARSPNAPDLASAIERAGDARVSRDGEQLRITGLSASRIGELALEAGVPLSELEPEHRSLEQRYMELTQGKGR
jgi:ABC-2 type transport system ATP-binding protein